MWGYVIATFAGLLATMSPATTEYRVTIDNLNHFMSRHQLPGSLQQRLRDFFQRTPHLMTAKADRSLVVRMPLSLQGELLELVHEGWLDKVPFLYHQDARSPHLIAELVLSMAPAIFPPSDLAPPNRLYVVQKGIVVYGGANLSNGEIWGADCVLSTDYLRSRNTARAIGFLEVHYISREALLEIVARYPATHRRMRRFIAALAFRRMFALCGMAKRRPLRVIELCAQYPTTLGKTLNLILRGLGDDGIEFPAPPSPTYASEAKLVESPGLMSDSLAASGQAAVGSCVRTEEPHAHSNADPYRHRRGLNRSRSGLEGSVQSLSRKVRVESVLTAISSLQAEVREATARQDSAIAALSKQLSTIRNGSSRSRSKVADEGTITSSTAGAATADGHGTVQTGVNSQPGRWERQGQTCVCVHVSGAGGYESTPVQYDGPVLDA